MKTHKVCKGINKASEGAQGIAFLFNGYFILWNI